MMKYIYVDFENLNNLKELKEIEGKYIFFIGATQDKINTNLVITANKSNVNWIRISGNGKNALDFHIVYYLSKNDTDRDVDHFILSKDTGFDPLIEHLKDKGISVKRIITIDEAFGKNNQQTKTAQSDFDLCYTNLSKIQKSKRPKAVKSLTSQFITLLGKEKDVEVKAVIEDMFRKKIISLGENNRLKYM